MGLFSVEWFFIYGTCKEDWFVWLLGYLKLRPFLADAKDSMWQSGNYNSWCHSHDNTDIKHAYDRRQGLRKIRYELDKAKVKGSGLNWTQNDEYKICLCAFE